MVVGLGLMTRPSLLAASVGKDLTTWEYLVSSLVTPATSNSASTCWSQTPGLLLLKAGSLTETVWTVLVSPDSDMFVQVGVLSPKVVSSYLYLCKLDFQVNFRVWASWNGLQTFAWVVVLASEVTNEEADQGCRRSRWILYFDELSTCLHSSGMGKVRKYKQIHEEILEPAGTFAGRQSRNLSVSTTPPRRLYVVFFGRPRVGRVAGEGGSSGSVCAGLMRSNETQSERSP